MPSQMQNILNRLSDSVRVGWRSAVQAYRQDYFVAEQDYNWDSHAARMSRYYYNRRYVDNTLYTAVNRFANQYKQTEQLYKYLRGLRNPVARLVNAEMDKVFGGFVNYESFKDGAIVLGGADETLIESIRTIYQWTNIIAFKSLLVRQGASMGDVAIKVIDDTKRQRVYMEVLDPRKVQDVLFDERGNVKEITISYERCDEETKRWYEYTEIITKDTFSTYRNGEPYAYMSDSEGNGLSEWPNPYGFVPVVWVKHVDVGMQFGATSFQDTRSKIDNLNDLTTLLHDNIRQNVRTKYAVTKVSIPKDANGNAISLGVSTDSRDTSPLIEMGDGGDIKPIAFQINIEGTLQAIDGQMKEIEADLPILALNAIRSMGGTKSGVTVENLYSDGLGAVSTLQGNYYGAMIAGTQMAISIASFRRYDGFRAYNLNSYENGSLDFVIRPKAVFQDKLSLKENVELTLQAVDSNASETLLLKLGYTDEEIALIEEKKANKERKATRSNLSNQANDLRSAARQQSAMQRLQTEQAQDTVATANLNEGTAL